MDSYRVLVDELDRYLQGGETSWFPREHPEFQGGPIGYFSMEYGWHECLGVYSGGLGVLSGDTCKSASDLGIPFVGVGLMYRRGYFRQTIDPDGNQQHFYPDYDLQRLPVLPVAGRDGRPLRVEVDLAGRSVKLAAWTATVGRVPVLLLDTNVPENDRADRAITSFLYVRGREMRLCQEIVLGVGGVRLLDALDIAPSVWHMNEGHSAFLSLERIRTLVRDDRLSVAEAGRRTAGNTLFTTHTPVPAGNESFDGSLVSRYLASCAADCGVPVEQLLDLGRAPSGEGGDFNLTALALRTSSQANGVSELHGAVARELWVSLRGPGPKEPTPIVHVTNGVHTPSWVGPEMGALLRLQPRGMLDGLGLEAGFAESVLALPPDEVWRAHQVQKKRLVSFARERALEQFSRHGRSPDELRQVAGMLDPEALTLGFARRFATYKRASLLFRDRERLLRILTSHERPVQILLAGKAHPADEPGRGLIRDIFQVSLSAGFNGRVLFLEDYDMRVARFLVQGVDVWLNTPRRPLEASGTSGMKAAVNGGLNFSILDGWWCEGYDPSHGWVIGRGEQGGDPEQQDRDEAGSLYEVLENEIVPCFYRRDPSGLPEEWVERMKRAIALLAPRFGTTRMMQEYAERLYLPASRREGWGSELDEVQFWAP